MRHLKRYNESKEELKELIETHLSYLLDDSSFNVEVENKERYSSGGEYYVITIFKLISVARDIIKWDDVKEEVIPFLYTIKSEYDLIEFRKIDANGYLYDDDGLHNIQFDKYIRSRTYGERSSERYVMSVDNVIADRSVPEEFYSIKIVVEK